MSGRNVQTEPNKHGPHWSTVRELWMQKDKEQCESWKDEVQNILIFSGLFSAIVTAFLIVSQQNLLPDPTQETNQLLRQIAAQSAGKNWVADDVQQGVDSISICVNVFWFLSLVLSLTTALVGIVALQWIRSHMLTMNEGAADSLGISYMHSLGLRQSCVPLIFTSLPILLIFGLTFFLIGLIVFLFQISWRVAIPVTLAVACTFAFLFITTARPLLQSLPKPRQSNKPDFFPSSYRSPESLILLRPRDWAFRSKQWLQRRTDAFFHADGGNKALSHLIPESIRAGVSKPEPFAYDTIQALIEVKNSRSAESDKERTALARCLAEVLPIHLDLFPTDDLADLIPFLPPSPYVPSVAFSQDSATRDELNAVAFLQIATCMGKPTQTTPLIAACVCTTRWLFEKPRPLDLISAKQPLHLIQVSESGKPHSTFFGAFSHLLNLANVLPGSDTLAVLIDSLSRFFVFATDYRPDYQILQKTTHTSTYTYWFLSLSASILAQCELSTELQSRHMYILHLITVRLNGAGDKVNEYLFHTASIYASKIAHSNVLLSAPYGVEFLSAVDRRRKDFLTDNPSPICRALKADEVQWQDFSQQLQVQRQLSTYT